MKLVIKKGQVVDLENKDIQIRDVLIEGEKIVRVEKNINFQDAYVIDAENLYLIPGLIDLHAHLREPGREDEEDLFSGSLSAIKGGFTTVCCMPNTQPPIDNSGLAKYLLEKGRKLNLIDILPVGAITKSRAGKELTEMIRMKSAGCIAFSDDGDWVENSNLMRRALEYSLLLDVPLILHCEDKSLSQDGVMNESRLSLELGLKGIPREAEIIAVQRDIELAKLTGARIHITHISCKESLELIKEAKERGISVTADTCPHYLMLDEESVIGYNTNAKVNPPLRTKKDKEALVEALKQGIIDCISTDHAPHSREEKDCEFVQAASGMIGFESALGLGFMLVEEKKLDLISLLEKFSLTPAKILGLRYQGKIEPGFLAQIAVVDTRKGWMLTEEEIVSKSKNTPFLGWHFQGKVKHLIHRGILVMENFETKEVII